MMMNPIVMIHWILCSREGESYWVDELCRIYISKIFQIIELNI